MSGDLPNKAGVRAGLWLYTLWQGLTTLVGVGLSVGVFIVDGLVRDEMARMLLVMAFLCSLVLTGFGVLGLFRSRRMAVLARETPWRLIEFAFGQVGGPRASSTGLIFLREPHSRVERVLLVTGFRRGTDLLRVSELTIPFCGDCVEGGMVYVPSVRRLLWIRPFLDPESAQANVRSLVSQGRMSLGEREYQESYRKPLRQQHDTWTEPAKRGFDTDRLR
jgi:hypothetical protein